MNSKTEKYGKHLKNLLILFLKLAMAILIVAMMGSEWFNFKANDVVLHEAWIKYSNANEFERLSKGQMAFTAINYDEELKDDEGFVVNGPNYGGKSRYIILHLPYSNTEIIEPRVHIKGILGSTVSIFNNENHLYYSDNRKIVITDAINQLSEVYVPYDASGLNIMIEGRNKDHFIGLDGQVELVSYKDGLKTIFLDGYARRVIAFFLLIATVTLFMIRRWFSLEHAKNLFEALAFFFGCFGMWVMLDFDRYSLWIIEIFNGIPIIVLKILYAFAFSFLNYGFANLCYHMLEESRFSKFLKGLRLYALVLGVSYFLMAVLILFVWTPSINQVYRFVEHINMASISVGSLILLVISILEAVKGSRTAVIFSVGFAVCEVTFIISQTTPILISHWGVLILAVTFATIISHEFNLAKRENLEYTGQLIQKNKEMSRLYSDLEGAQHEILYLLGSAVDLRSKETSNHVKRVAEYTRAFALELGYNSDESNLIALASTLHDIGKVGISDLILNKPDKLTSAEYDIMKSHAQMGYDMLKESELELIRTAAIIAMNHHERYDGTGYPHGYKGDEIHPYGRIVAAADVLDALLSSRIYKDEWSFENVVQYFESERGKQFEPSIVDILIQQQALFKNITEAYE